MSDSDVAHLRQFGRTPSDTDHPWKLTEKCAEDAWFLYTLVCLYRDRNQLDVIDFATTALPSQRISCVIEHGNSSLVQQIIMNVISLDVVKVITVPSIEPRNL